MYTAGLAFGPENQGACVIAPDGRTFMVPGDREHYDVFVAVCKQDGIVSYNQRVVTRWLYVDSYGYIHDANHDQPEFATQAQLDVLADLATAHDAYADASGYTRHHDFAARIRAALDAY